MRNALFITPIAILMAGSAMAAEADLKAAAEAENKVIIDEDAPEDVYPRPKGETNTVFAPEPGVVEMSPEHLVPADEAEVVTVPEAETEAEADAATGAE
ncbi:MAG: hypothetical protein TEF_10390 [Rhizobiales bacterium NRL2]|jgi:hypothetical protein|nr:MAG: hypothetical protein TEF_10390 [Rhizobiales bacterium NRL2]